MSARSKYVVILVGGVPAALLTLYIQRLDESDNGADLPVSETPAALLDRELPLQRADTGPLNEGLNLTASNRTGDDSSKHAEPVSIRPTMARPLEIWNERGASPPMLEATDSAFAAEPVDAVWSPAMEVQILSEVAQLNRLDLVNLQVECRSSMCRVQLTQNVSLQPVQIGPTAMPRFDELFSRLGYDGPAPPVAMIRDGAGAVTSVAYLRRDAAKQNSLGQGN